VVEFFLDQLLGPVTSGLVIAFIIWFSRTIRKILLDVSEVPRIKEDIARIKGELTVNGGSSLKDQVMKIEDTVSGLIEQRSEEHGKLWRAIGHNEGKHDVRRESDDLGRH